MIKVGWILEYTKKAGLSGFVPNLFFLPSPPSHLILAKVFRIRKEARYASYKTVPRKVEVDENKRAIRIIPGR